MRSLSSLLDEELMTAAFDRIREGAAAGIDGMTKSDYAGNEAANIRSLREKMKAGQYRHAPVRRVHIPKGPGKTRPIGISTVQDKVVQNALAMVLEALYEPVFLDSSHGFRPRRGAHDALRALNGAALRGECNWVIEADIQSFFDSIDRKLLTEMLRGRIADETFMRLIGKCLHVGVLDGEQYSEPDEGTVQGSTLSPMLGNIYLHNVLDAWFERDVRPRMRGKALLVRYADDFVIAFEHQDDARRVMEVLPRRMAKYGLNLHPDKTRLIRFERPPRGPSNGSGRATFDFLGFTAYWRRTRKGSWVLGLKTRKARLAKAIKAIGDWCRRHRHEPITEQHATLKQKLRGHFQYFGVNGNMRGLRPVARAATSLWLKWLRRRSQRSKLTWQRLKDLLEVYPLPAPAITVQIWAPRP